MGHVTRRRLWALLERWALLGKEHVEPADTTLILAIALSIVGGCCLTLCAVLIVVCVCRKKAADTERASVAKALANTNKNVDVKINVV